MRPLVLLFVLWLPLLAQGQSWQQVYDEVMTSSVDDDEAGEALEDSYELLEQLADHPLNLNTATRQELEQLPFLSAQQVMDLQEYIYHYGPMRSLGELRMVRSLDYQQLTLLPFFVYVDSKADEPQPRVRQRLDSLLHWARHTLTASARVPFYQRQGDKNGYLGYPYRHSLRYELSSSQQLRLGLVASQDAGEPLFGRDNKLGYDYYSYYLQLSKLARLENFVAGRYKLSAGMGLVLGQSFQLGKLATLQNLGRATNTIRPHGSRSEADYFQGAAATVRLWKPLSLSLFASYRPVDATLNERGEAQTLITSGYHRTPTEMQKKSNTHLAAAGARAAYRQGAWQLGATAIASQLDRTLQPQRETLYRRHYAHGRRFQNMSLDYAFSHHRFALGGETATDGHGHLATVNSLSFQPSARLSMMALQRFYSFRYTTLYGHSFGEGSRTQNESGLYLGATWNPLAHLRLQGYVDYAYFPWARYQVSFTSHAWDCLLQATWQRRQWTVLARHRSRLRQRDNEQHTALTANDEHRERLAVAFQQDGLTLKTQLDLAYTRYLHPEGGWMLSQQAAYSRRQLLVSLLAVYFDTDSYQSRIYLSERLLQHEFYFPAYYGRGLRLSALARIDLNSRLRLAARLGYTDYFDRSTIGTALQQILHSHQTDLDLQLRWKF